MTPHLFEALVSLLLYADDVILIFPSAAGLQWQLDALQGFREQLQLIDNLMKMKLTIFEASKSECIDFVLHGRVAEWVESYRYLSFHVPQKTCLMCISPCDCSQKSSSP